MKYVLWEAPESNVYRYLSLHVWDPRGQCLLVYFLIEQATKLLVQPEGLTHHPVRNLGELTLREPDELSVHGHRHRSILASRYFTL